MKTGLIALYDEALPHERAALPLDEREHLDEFLRSIEGREIKLVFTAGDAFEEKDNDIWLPPSLWDEISEANDKDLARRALDSE
ncbi:MAG: hypothetical protein NTV52_02955 [Acidobacteria bacterium]|nr:hypothetical protein [Acidobacteriota bacterium]